MGTLEILAVIIIIIIIIIMCVWKRVKGGSKWPLEVAMLYVCVEESQGG